MRTSAHLNYVRHQISTRYIEAKPGLYELTQIRQFKESSFLSTSLDKQVGITIMLYNIIEEFAVE